MQSMTREGSEIPGGSGDRKGDGDGADLQSQIGGASLVKP
jgi:hypothetical protein